MAKSPQQRILDVALTLFDRQGYAATSMDAIRKEAGFATKSSLYTHFSSKQALAQILFERILSEEAAALARYMVDPSKASLRDLLEVAAATVRWGLTHQAAYRFCFLQWHQEPQVSDPAIQSEMSRALDWALLVLERLQRESERVRDWPAGELIQACQGVINQVIVTAPPTLLPSAIDQIAQHTRILCQAIVTAG